MHVPFHTNCREGWGCHPSCPVAALARHAQQLEQQQTNKMDAGTAADMVEDLMITIALGDSKSVPLVLGHRMMIWLLFALGT